MTIILNEDQLMELVNTPLCVYEHILAMEVCDE